MGTVTITRGAPRPGARAAPTVARAAAAGSVTAITVPIVVVPAAIVVVPVSAASAAAIVVIIASAPTTTIVVSVVSVSSSAATTSAPISASSATASIATPAVTIAVLTHTTGNVLDGDDAGVQLATVGRLLGLLGLLGGGVLDEGVVALHVDAYELSEGLEQHLQILALGRLLVEVDDEQSFGGLDVLATLILLALGAAIAAGELGAERLGNVGDFPVDHRIDREILEERKGRKEIGFSPGKGSKG